MPRKKKKPPTANIVAPVVKSDASDAGRMLVNKLSIKDARHLLHSEGELDPSQVAIRIITIIVVGATSAYAIWVGKATAWHLLLPMLAEYLALNVGVAAALVITRHKDLRKDGRNAFLNMAAWPILIGVIVTVRAYWNDTASQDISWQAQLANDLRATWNWISDYHMQWPMLAAAVSVFLDLPYRVKNLWLYGPPFVSVGLGCALRALMPFLAFFILPVIVNGTLASNAWVLWGLILLAESTALWLHWDVQRRLRKLDGASAEEATKN